MLQNLVLKTTYLPYSMVMEHIVVLLVDPCQNHVSITLLAIELETLGPWAIFDALAYLISTHAWERLVVLD